MNAESPQPEHSKAQVRLELNADQTEVVASLIRRARQQVGSTGGSRSFAPSIVFGEVDLPWFDASNPDKDMTRAEFRCGVVSAKAARKIRKVLAEDAPPVPVVVLEQEIRPRIVAVDFETLYDTEYSVTKLGYHAYVHDARFNAYLVSFWADDGWHWVGHPRNAPWEKINGATWLSHNAQFDRAVFFRLQEMSVIAKHIAPLAWHCTSALSVYLAAPRNLAGAARELPPETLSRYMRAAKLSMLVAQPIGSDTVPEALPDVQNKQALIALGIIPSPENKRPSLLDPQRGWVRYVRFLDGFRKWFNKRIEDEPLDTWDEQPRRLLKNELRWIAELYQRL